MPEKITYRPNPKALLNPCIDPIFKRLFTDSSPEGQKALQSFLEAVLQKPVSNIVLQPEELPINSLYDKKSRFDLNCEIDKTEYANIEMQNYNCQEIYEKRAEYYCAHLLNHHVPEGLKWQKIPKVYQISVLNFIREKDFPREIFHYKFRTEDGLLLEERQNIIFIELPKVRQIVTNIINKTQKIEKLTATQKWCIFMLYASNDELYQLIQEIAKSEDGIMCAVKTLDKISQDEIAWKQQFDQLMLENDRISFLEYATQTGLKKGMEEGLQKGLQKGLQQGIKEGIQSVAKKLLEKDIPIEIIKSTTGLTDEEISKLM